MEKRKEKRKEEKEKRESVSFVSFIFGGKLKAVAVGSMQRVSFVGLVGRFVNVVDVDVDVVLAVDVDVFDV